MLLKKIFKLTLAFMLLIVAGLYFTETNGFTDLGILDALALSGASSSSLAVCVSVASISESCGANPGGQTELYVIRKEDIETFPVPDADGVTLATAIIPKVGKGFAKWDFAQDTGEITVTGTGEDGAQSFEQGCSVYIPRWTPDIAKVVNAALNQKYIIATVDGNGQILIGGDMLRPMVFTMDYKSGAKFNDKNGGTYTFKTGISHVPFFYTGVLPVLGEAPAEGGA